MNTFPLAADMKALREPEPPSSGSKSKIKTASTPKSCSLHSKGDLSFGAGLKTMLAYKAIVRAYNGWLAEEYCAVDPDRLIGVGILPLTHAMWQIASKRWNNVPAAGLKTVLLQGFPSGKAYPSKEDDLFWAAALDLKMPVSVHVDLDRTGERAGPLFKYPQESDELMKKLSHDLVDQVRRFGPVRGNGSVAAVSGSYRGCSIAFPTCGSSSPKIRSAGFPFSCRQRTCAMIAMSDGPSACSVSNLCAVCRASTSASIACGDFNSIASGLSCATRSMSMVSSGARIFRIRNPTGPNP